MLQVQNGQAQCEGSACSPSSELDPFFDESLPFWLGISYGLWLIVGRGVEPNQAMDSPLAELGFTRSFVAHLQHSKEQLSKYVNEKKLQADAMQVSLDQLQSNQQEIVNEVMERLKQIQLQRGIVSAKETTDSPTTEVINTAAHLSLVKDKQVQLEQDLAQAHALLTQTQAHLEGTSIFYTFLNYTA
jgi:hypothetical protein